MPSWSAITARSRFTLIPSVRCKGRDCRGREYVEDWGHLGSPLRPKKRLYVRRITLYRPGDEDLILVTNLCDAAAFPAVDLLEVYLNRWGIERMFQQVVEVFGLSHLMGTTPEGTSLPVRFVPAVVQSDSGSAGRGRGRDRATTRDDFG